LPCVGPCLAITVRETRNSNQRTDSVVMPTQGVLLYGPPGTGKTLLARAIASNIEANFLKVVASAIVDKYIGESARLIREMFGYARDHQPCIIFMDEVRLSAP